MDGGLSGQLLKLSKGLDKIFGECDLRDLGLIRMKNGKRSDFIVSSE